MANSYLTIDPKEIDQPSLHRYLLTAVAPRPIALVSTIDQQGSVNLSPFSFFNIFSSNPPTVIFSPARSGRDNTTKHTYDNAKVHPEAVVNIVNYPIVEQMSLSSTAYAKGVNEFVKAGFTEVASDIVKPPRVGESPVSLECTIKQIIELGTEGGAGNLIIGEVVKIHINRDYLNADNQLDTKTLDLVGRMGGSHYIRATQDSLFEIPKPIKTKGIGIDQLPNHIKSSKHLTGNQLARLGNYPSLPSSQEAQIIAKRLDITTIDEIDKKVAKYIDSNDIDIAIGLAFLKIS